jgi:hypothetical protein
LLGVGVRFASTEKQAALAGGDAGQLAFAL